MASPEERQIARLGDNFDFGALRQMMAAREEEAVQALARKTYKIPEQHDRVEWEKLASFWNGVRHVFSTVESAQAAVRKAESQRK